MRCSAPRAICLPRSAIAATSIDNPPPQTLISAVAYAQPLRVRISDAEAKSPVMLDDMASAGRGEVGAEDQHRLIGVPFHERTPRLASLVGVGIEGAKPIGMPKLDRMMHQVAGDHGFLAF